MIGRRGKGEAEPSPGSESWSAALQAAAADRVSRSFIAHGHGTIVPPCIPSRNCHRTVAFGRGEMIASVGEPLLCSRLLEHLVLEVSKVSRLPVGVIRRFISDCLKSAEWSEVPPTCACVERASSAHAQAIDTSASVTAHER